MPGVLSHMKPEPRVRKMRRPPGLTQKEFARHRRIALGTQRDKREQGQGRTNPDHPACTYVAVITHNPGHLRRAQGRGVP